MYDSRIKYIIIIIIIIIIINVNINKHLYRRWELYKHTVWRGCVLSAKRLANIKLIRSIFRTDSVFTEFLLRSS